MANFSMANCDEPRIPELVEEQSEADVRDKPIDQQTVGDVIDAVGDQIIKYRETATGWDTVAVPTYGIGKQNVPESMKENAPQNWRDIPIHQVEILPEYGPEHDSLVQLRKDLEGMKRSITAIGPILETRLRCAQQLKDVNLDGDSEGNGANLSQDHVMFLMQDEEAQRKRDFTFESLRKQIEKTEDERTKKKLTPVIEEICKRGGKEFTTKEQYAEFWGFLKQQNTKIFAEQKNLLERIKVIKRAKQAELGTKPAEYEGGMEGFQSRGGGLKN